MTHCHYRHRDELETDTGRADGQEPAGHGLCSQGGLARTGQALGRPWFSARVTAEGGPCEVNSGGQGLAAVGVGGPFLPAEAEKPFSPRDGH